MVLPRSLRPCVGIVVASIAGLVVAPGLAEAHTELEFSMPAEAVLLAFVVAVTVFLTGASIS